MNALLPALRPIQLQAVLVYHWSSLTYPITTLEYILHAFLLVLSQARSHMHWQHACSRRRWWRFVFCSQTVRRVLFCNNSEMSEVRYEGPINSGGSSSTLLMSGDEDSQWVACGRKLRRSNTTRQNEHELRHNNHAVFIDLPLELCDPMRRKITFLKPSLTPGAGTRVVRRKKRESSFLVCLLSTQICAYFWYSYRFCRQPCLKKMFQNNLSFWIREIKFPLIYLFQDGLYLPWVLAVAGAFNKLWG